MHQGKCQGEQIKKSREIPRIPEVPHRPSEQELFQYGCDQAREDQDGKGGIGFHEGFQGVLVQIIWNVGLDQAEEECQTEPDQKRPAQ